ncbi:MAG TPA: hypothetical protein VLC09_13225 [Polyangiaceae bacterium]|nr:hypothetical protein [Polyangiaceae bacterium]
MKDSMGHHRSCSRRKWSLCAKASAAALLLGSGAWAQTAPAPATPATSPTAAPAAASKPQSAGEAAAPADTAAPPDTAAQPAAATEASEGGPTKAEFDALLAEVRALKEKQEESEAVQAASAEEVDVHEDLFKLYGFMDMGLQRHFTNPEAITSSVFDSNATTFATGNIDLYFDFNPVQDWRALAEIRFTNAPLGRVTNYGGLAGTFERVSTEQYDPNATVPNAPMWGGYAVIERAQIEWSRYEKFKLIVGYFFTPFGIWNVDHGSPTLLTMAMPQFIQQKWLPLRQTGVQALGSFFSGEWELAYRAWISNGRTEQNPLDYDDDKGFGARVLAKRDRGAGDNLTLGLSYQYDHVRDKVINVTGFAPITFQQGSTWDYDEHVMGADVSLDIADTKIRAEGIVRRQDWYTGKQVRLGVENPGAYLPDRWQYGGYLTVAQQLPWWGLEPYVYGELLEQPWDLADGTGIISAGLNWHFTPATLLKLQAAQVYFFNWLYQAEGDPSMNNVGSLSARLVVAF